MADSNQRLDAYRHLAAVVLGRLDWMHVRCSPEQGLRLARVLGRLIRASAQSDTKPSKVNRAEVIRCRFGIGRPRQTLKEIGDSYGVSRERIREIEARMLRYMKHPQRSRELRILLAKCGLDVSAPRDLSS